MTWCRVASCSANQAVLCCVASLLRQLLEPCCNNQYTSVMLESTIICRYGHFWGTISSGPLQGDAELSETYMSYVTCIWYCVFHFFLLHPV